MTKNLFAGFAALLLALTACQQDNKCTFTGTLPDASYDGRVIYLRLCDPLHQNPDILFDSTIVRQSKYVLHGYADDSLRIAVISFAQIGNNDHYSTFSQHVFLQAGVTSLTYSDIEAVVTGTSLNEQYYATVIQAERQMRLANQQANGNTEQMRQIADDFMIQYTNFLEQVAGTPAGDYLYFRYPTDRYPERVREQLLQQANPATLRRQAVRDSLRREREKEFQQSKQQLTIGTHYRDISGQRPDGTPVSLSELVNAGHVTLLDFWASWCVPCRHEIPIMKELYTKYHNKGLDIIACSLDHSEAAWLAALDKEQMPWPQFSELKGWDGIITQQYGIQAIPYLILLDKRGNICQINLHDKLLEDEIIRQLNAE